MYGKALRISGLLAVKCSAEPWVLGFGVCCRKQHSSWQCEVRARRQGNGHQAKIQTVLPHVLASLSRALGEGCRDTIKPALQLIQLQTLSSTAFCHINNGGALSVHLETKHRGAQLHLELRQSFPATAASRHRQTMPPALTSSPYLETSAIASPF